MDGFAQKQGFPIIASLGKWCRTRTHVSLLRSYSGYINRSSVLFSYPFAAFGSWSVSWNNVLNTFEHDDVVVTGINNFIANRFDAWLPVNRCDLHAAISQTYRCQTLPMQHPSLTVTWSVKNFFTNYSFCILHQNSSTTFGIILITDRHAGRITEQLAYASQS